MLCNHCICWISIILIILNVVCVLDINYVLLMFTIRVSVMLNSCALDPCRFFVEIFLHIHACFAVFDNNVID